MNKNISINKQVKPLVERLIESREKLNLIITESEGGAKIIDAGIKTKGCLEAGRIITEICMGGLGTVSLSMTSNIESWPLSIHVHSTDPVLSCLGSQYAGWSLSFVQNDDNFSALGSGPCRALAGKEDIFSDIDYKDNITIQTFECTRCHFIWKKELDHADSIDNRSTLWRQAG